MVITVTLVYIYIGDDDPSVHPSGREGEGGTEFVQLTGRPRVEKESVGGGGGKAEYSCIKE